MTKTTHTCFINFPVIAHAPVVCGGFYLFFSPILSTIIVTSFSLLSPPFLSSSSLDQIRSDQIRFRLRSQFRSDRLYKTLSNSPFFFSSFHILQRKGWRCEISFLKYISASSICICILV